MQIRRPNFLVAGAQKSGTSYLCAALSRHHEIFHTDPKEPLFFQRADVTTGSFERYLAQFYSNAADQPRVGEGSTVYFQWPRALENIKAHLDDDLQVIISLRHPTDRAVSFYLHNLRKGRITGSERICDIGDDIRMSPVLSSRYASHLERWFEAYGDKVKVMRFDDLLTSPVDFLMQATSFLGVEPLGEVSRKAVNKGYGLVWQEGCLTVDAPAEPGQVVPSFTKAELEDLHALFLNDIDRTQALLGISLDGWKSMPEFTARQAGW